MFSHLSLRSSLIILLALTTHQAIAIAQAPVHGAGGYVPNAELVNTQQGIAIDTATLPRSLVTNPGGPVYVDKETLSIALVAQTRSSAAEQVEDLNSFVGPDSGTTSTTLVAVSNGSTITSIITPPIPVQSSNGAANQFEDEDGSGIRHRLPALSVLVTAVTFISLVLT